jgi:REP element-mobilizing transposase RayT
MGRPLRFVEPNSTVEITTRTIQGRFLLRPSPETNDAILGVMGRALSLYPEIQLHAFVVASNHMHLLLTTPTAIVMSDFMRHVNGKIAREVGMLINWTEKFWGRRYSHIPVVDGGAQVGRMRYVIAHGCKECLVDLPQQWPGASSVRALLCGTALEGRWIDRAKLALALKRHREGEPLPEAKDFAIRYPITLTPLPCWRRLDPRQLRCAVRSLVRKVERDAVRENKRLGRRPLGARRVCAQSPHTRPERMKRSPSPRVHASTRSARLAFLDAYRVFETAYRQAVARLKEGERDVQFPPHAFVPAHVAPAHPAPSAVPRCGSN